MPTRCSTPRRAPAGRRVVEVADVLRDERLVAARDADGVLEPAAGREHGRALRAGEARPRRGVKPRARRTNWHARARSAPRASHDAVVAAHHDVAVVRRAASAMPRQPRDAPRRCRSPAARRRGWRWSSPAPASLRVARASRARRPARGLVEQQVLERRVRQHHAQPGESGRHARRAPRRHRRACAAARSARSADSSSARSAAPTRPARPAMRRWRPSPRRASPRAACARAAAPRPRRCARRRRGGSRRAP